MDTLFIQNTGEKDLTTGNKPFSQNAYFVHFLEGHLSALHSRLAKESRIFRKPFKIIVSSTVKKHVSKFDRSLPIPPHLMFSNERSNVTL